MKGSQCSIEIILSCIFDSLIIKYIGGAVYLFQFYYFLRDGDTFAWNTDFYSEYCFMGPSFAVYFWEPDDFFKVFLESFHSFAVTWSSKHKMCEGFFFFNQRCMKKSRVWNPWPSQICKPLKNNSLSCA